MKIKKGIIVFSFILGITALILAVILEFRILNNWCNIKFLIGHREFIKSICVGIFSSSIIVLMVAFTEYQKEKRRIIGDYLRIVKDLYIDTNYLAYWMIQYIDEAGTFELQKDEMEDFNNVLHKVHQSLMSANILRSNYSPFVKYDSELNILRKYQLKNKSLVYALYEFNKSLKEVSIYVENTYESYRLALLNIGDKDHEVFYSTAIDYIRELPGYIDDKSKLAKELELLPNSLKKYLKL